ncbi:MAG: response regulator [Armatimonadia bacterium]|nr:response regulator [Armatimonadia bacterium]
MSMTALLVHGEASDYDELRRRLESGGLTVAEADTGVRALAHVEVDRPALVIVDDELPDMSGVELCRQISTMCSSPVLLIGQACERHELAARVDRLLASSQGAQAGAVRDGRLLVLGDLRLDLRTNRVTVADRNVDLPPTQVNLLRSLMGRSPQVISPEALARRVWPRGDHDHSALADVIMGLRVALEEDPSNPRRIIYVPDYGYRLDPVPASSVRTVSRN